MKLSSAVVIVMLVVAGCAAESQEPEWTPTVEKITVTYTPAYEQKDYRQPKYPDVEHHDNVNKSNVEDEIIEEINFERGIEKFPRVTEDERLSNIARNYSMEMAKRDFFAHKDPEGDLPMDRLEEHRYHCAGLQEILAKNGYKIPMEGDQGTVTNITSEEGLGEAFVKQWLNSVSHRKAILWDDAVTVGVGVHVEPNGTAWATAIFCSNRSR